MTNRSQYRGQKQEDTDSWVFSYADMMTLLLGFFVILFSLSKIEENRFNSFAKEISKSLKSNKVVEKKIAKNVIEEQKSHALDVLLAMMQIGSNDEDAIRQIRRFQKSENQSEQAMQILLNSLAQKNKKLFEGIRSSIDPKDRSIEIVLPEVALFDTGQAELNKEAVRIVRGIGSELTAVKDLVRIRVVGHTDSRLPRSSSVVKDNFTLSAARATSVARELIRVGMEADLLEISGMGPLKPLLPEKTPDGKWIERNMASNRRVHIYVDRKPI